MHSQNINLPSKPKIIKEEDNKGIYEIDGLYPGYGYTLGNSIRRIIISSIPGAAITSLSIEGVKHEFSTIEGIKEDVISLILNLKAINFTLHSDESQKISLKVKGPKVVTAADLDVNSEVEVLNKDAYLCEITGKVTLEMEMTIEKGIGYISKEQVEKERTAIGDIALDAAFTPVKRASYEVENMRVGDRTDHNRLRFFIETDGTISPKEVLEYSISLMIKQLQAVVGFKENVIEAEEGMMSDNMVEGAQDTAESPTKVKIEELQFSTRTENALLAGGVKTLSGLLKKTESDLKALGGLGDKAVEEIRELLEGKGLSLKQEKK
ncbi:MAG TPA: DNA-directed RNA polymerase subunit alpha [Candidatus Paceibacterota bacterium]|nr:DNA-directed RNA polymerase subunit alpha [Candidatus Paceibacterota bacterium]HQB57293.1 DNA-directed RNA polymerase subunit alpha [Candidatus Paceibacterota bacterium]